MRTTCRAAALFLTVLVILEAGSQAFAQPQTGTGGGPGSTVTAPHTSNVGRTKPPGAAAGEATPDDKRTRKPQDKEDDKLMRGICIGCGAK